MKSLTMNLDPKSIQKTIDWLENNYEDYCNDRLDVAENEVAKVGAEAARNKYLTTKYYGTRVCSVFVRKEKDCKKVVMEGPDIAFMEFGAGVYANNETYKGLTMAPGSWSQSELGYKFFKPGVKEWWYFLGKKRKGEHPTNAIPSAVYHMTRSVRKKIKGAFTDD